MPDTSSSSTQTMTAEDIASIYQELESAEKTADELEGRLEELEKKLDELLEKLENEEKNGSTSRTESQ
jgi:predicted transcriptional regulator